MSILNILGTFFFIGLALLVASFFVEDKRAAFWRYGIAMMVVSVVTFIIMLALASLFG